MKNNLMHETSPYLLQHKDNPVWWQPWSEESLELAANENKPIFLSIGYATCHWCHVMEHESFEDEEVAEILNDGFVAIKVDREERPDIDDLYMAVVQQLTGGGGWPMSVWLLPDGKPFFGGTYFPKDQFLQLNERILAVWNENPERVREDAGKLSDFLKIMNEGVSGKKADSVDRKVIDQFIEDHRKSFDADFGGFGNAPKFPQTMNLQVLMREYLNGDEKLQKQLSEMIQKTLDGMCKGGMYDHLVGGFARYSTDERWIVPHFEKMLYDNALLASTYLDASVLFERDDYKLVATETLDYVIDEMTGEGGGYFSAQDADSETPDGHKEEGYFCTFTAEEIQNSLNAEELEKFSSVYDFYEKGHFEGRVVLCMNKSSGFADKQDSLILSAFEKLRKIRAGRPAPITDDKRLLAWNALMISAMAKGYRVLGESRYLDSALDALNFIREKMVHEGRLYRSWRDSRLTSPGFCDDYACLIAALIDIYQCDFDEEHLTWARSLQADQDRLFWSEEHGSYYRNDGQDPTLISRVRDEYDGVTPSSNSLSACNLFSLYQIFGDVECREKGMRVIQSGGEQLEKYPMSRPQLLLALQDSFGSRQIVLSKNSDEVLTRIGSMYWPDVIVGVASSDSEIPLLKGKASDEFLVYPCEEGSCQKPVSSWEELLEAMN